MSVVPAIGHYDVCCKSQVLFVSLLIRLLNRIDKHFFLAIKGKINQINKKQTP